MNACRLDEPTTCARVRQYYCGLVAARCEIVELNGLYYVSEEGENTDNPRVSGSAYSKGYETYDAALTASASCRNCLAMQQLEYVGALPQ